MPGEKKPELFWRVKECSQHDINTCKDWEKRGPMTSEKLRLIRGQQSENGVPAGARSYKDLNRGDKGFGLVWEEGESHGIQSQGQDHSVTSMLSRDRKLTTHQGTQLRAKGILCFGCGCQFWLCSGRALFIKHAQRYAREKHENPRAFHSALSGSNFFVFLRSS